MQWSRRRFCLVVKGGRQPQAHDFFHGIERIQPHPNAIVVIGRQMQSHEVGLDGRFTMSAIDQHGQSDSFRSAQVLWFLFKLPVARDWTFTAGLSNHETDETGRRLGGD